jgi:hypothetical protein
VDKNYYSVPTEYAGFQVRALLSVDRVRIFYSGREIASQERAYGKNKYVLEPDHYLNLLLRRPGAFAIQQGLSNNGVPGGPRIITSS